MTDEDMIRRGDALAATEYNITDDDDRMTTKLDIAALPAVKVVVKALEWTERADGLQWYGHSPKGMHLSYTVLPEIPEDPEGPWVSFLDDLWRKFPSLEAAKAAAQADYEARIRSALTVQHAPEVAGLEADVHALRERMADLLHAVMWTYDRITVERITLTELAATAHELEQVMLRKPSHAATYDPPDFMTSPARKVLSRAALAKLEGQQ